MKDPYDVLGIQKNSSEDEIKNAYKKLVLEYHPDRNKSDGAEDKVKEVNVAFETLKNNGWRYDPTVHQTFGGFNGFNINLGDLFSNAFGGGFGNPFNRQNNNIRVGQIAVSLEEAYHGCKKHITIEDVVNCSKCNGGCILEKENCSVCQGTGQNRVNRGSVCMVSPCNTCKGFGKKISSICLECEGGKKKSISEMDINIPAGVGHGTRIKINNTLQIIILYLQHKEFNLNGIDTIANVEIDLFTSLLGGKANVNTLSGLKNVIIPEGCQNNTKLRIRKAGMKINDTLGDHYIILNTNIPKLTNEQKELLLKIKDLGEKETNG